MSNWEELQIETKVLAILDVWSHKPEHHFGRPFLAPYQIAVEFERRFAQEFAAVLIYASL